MPGRLGALAALAASMVIVVAGCAPSEGLAGGDAGVEPTDAGTAAPVDPVGPVMDGDELLLAPPNGGEPRHLASLQEADGEVLHLSLRPGDHPAEVVLALTRVRDDRGLRYEFRYLVVDGDEVTDLYWFPWRLQIDEDTANVLDVPPLPVWAPDGDAVAWIEWDANGTRLRTVGWLDHEEGSNPSDDTAAYLLARVPPGVQLLEWATAPEGTEIFTARSAGEPLEIRIERGLPHLRWLEEAVNSAGNSSAGGRRVEV